MGEIALINPLKKKKRKKNPITKKNTFRRRNPISRSDLKDGFSDGAIGAIAASGMDVLTGFLPAQFRGGVTGLLVQMAIGVGVGFMLDAVNMKRFARPAMSGIVAVTGNKLVQTLGLMGTAAAVGDYDDGSLLAYETLPSKEVSLSAYSSPGMTSMSQIDI